MQPLYLESFGTRLGDFPVAEKVLKQVLCLPMRYDLTFEDIDYIRDAIVDCIGEYAIVDSIGEVFN